MPLSPLLHDCLSVAPGLLHDNLLLLREQHVYILPVGAWLNEDNRRGFIFRAQCSRAISRRIQRGWQQIVLYNLVVWRADQGAVPDRGRLLRLNALTQDVKQFAFKQKATRCSLSKANISWFLLRFWKEKKGHCGLWKLVIRFYRPDSWSANWEGNAQTSWKKNRKLGHVALNKCVVLWGSDYPKLLYYTILSIQNIQRTIHKETNTGNVKDLGLYNHLSLVAS